MIRGHQWPSVEGNVRFDGLRLVERETLWQVPFSPGRVRDGEGVPD